MQIDRPTALLGGLSPARFMQRHWQKKPLVVRAALSADALAALPGVQALHALTQRDDVASRLITRRGAQWQLRHGPFERLPAARRAGWTVLVQGVNLHVPAVAALMRRFRFVPDARLDDVMFSYATDGGGVGPHVDSYDVFLLQVQGVRRWSFGPLRSAAARALVPGVPLKLLAQFAPTQTVDLQPGDMLYLPPGWGHDGVAQGACITASVGFRAPTQGELLARLFEQLAERARSAPQLARLYRDPQQPATRDAAALPAELARFVAQAYGRVQPRPADIERSLGQYLSEPKPQVWFDPPQATRWPQALRHGLRLADQSQLLSGRGRLYINGESVALPRADAPWWRRFVRQQGADA
ncbi:MAG: cupin domain-containing protein, partial [Betaproteobacteria bacterium]|nr:cupin domain-containing protein [Betaproteobacteria bacterium]